MGGAAESGRADLNHRELSRHARKKATKSGDFPPNLLENKVMAGVMDSWLWEILLSIVLLVTMATKFSTPCLIKFCFFSIFLQILTTCFKQLAILSLKKVNLGTIFETQVTLHMICDVIGIVQYLSKNPRWRPCFLQNSQTRWEKINKGLNDLNGI